MQRRNKPLDGGDVRRRITSAHTQRDTGGAERFRRARDDAGSSQPFEGLERRANNIRRLPGGQALLDAARSVSDSHEPYAGFRSVSGRGSRQRIAQRAGGNQAQRSRCTRNVETFHGRSSRAHPKAQERRCEGLTLPPDPPARRRQAQSAFGARSHRRARVVACARGRVRAPWRQR